MIKKITGIILLTSILAGLFYLTAKETSLLEATLAWLSAIGITGLMALAVILIFNDTDD